MYHYKATVVRVIDGDTLEVDIDLGFNTTLKKEKLRLLGIDTPELRSKNLSERVHAQEAKQFVERYCPPGSLIYLRTEKDKKGKYGRYLAHVTLSTGLDLVDMLVENGFEKKENYDVEEAKGN